MLLSDCPTGNVSLKRRLKTLTALWTILPGYPSKPFKSHQATLAKLYMSQGGLLHDLLTSTCCLHNASLCLQVILRVTGDKGPRQALPCTREGCGPSSSLGLDFQSSAVVTTAVDRPLQQSVFPGLEEGTGGD